MVVNMADQYLGIVQLNTLLSSSHLTVIPRNLVNGGTPKFADAAPAYRIYGPQGILNNATGTLTKQAMDTGDANVIQA